MLRAGPWRPGVCRGNIWFIARPSVSQAAGSGFDLSACIAMSPTKGLVRPAVQGTGMLPVRLHLLTSCINCFIVLLGFFSAGCGFFCCFVLFFFFFLNFAYKKGCLLTKSKSVLKGQRLKPLQGYPMDYCAWGQLVCFLYLFWWPMLSIVPYWVQWPVTNRDGKCTASHMKISKYWIHPGICSRPDWMELLEDVPGYGRGFGLRWVLLFLPAQTILWVYTKQPESGFAAFIYC